MLGLRQKRLASRVENFLLLDGSEVRQNMIWRQIRKKRNEIGLSFEIAVNDIGIEARPKLCDRAGLFGLPSAL